MPARRPLCGQRLFQHRRRQSLPGQPGTDCRSRQPPLWPRRTGRHQTPFQPVSGRHPRRTDCSTRCRAPPCHQNGSGHSRHRPDRTGRTPQRREDGGFVITFTPSAGHRVHPSQRSPWPTARLFYEVSVTSMFTFMIILLFSDLHQCYWNFTGVLICIFCHSGKGYLCQQFQFL